MWRIHPSRQGCRPGRRALQTRAVRFSLPTGPIASANNRAVGTVRASWKTAAACSRGRAGGGITQTRRSAGWSTSDPEFVARQIVQLMEGAVVTAFVEHDASASAVARSTAAQVLAASCE